MQYFLNLVPRLWLAMNKADFYRNITKILWLFFPSCLFVFFSFYTFWNISQGKDLMVYTLEHPKVYVFFIVAMIFWAYMVWYSSRLVAKAKFWEDADYFWLKVRVHSPRFLGFSCFTVIILAFLQLNIDESPKMRNGWASALLFSSVIYYLLLNRVWNYFVVKKGIAAKGFTIFFAVMIAVCFSSLYIFSSYSVLIVLLLILQIVAVLYFLARRKGIVSRMPGIYVQKEFNYGGTTGFGLLWKKIRRLFNDEEEKDNLKIFNIIAAIAFIIYIIAIISVRASVFLGTFPFVLLAFGVLLGFINLISTLSVFIRFNIHLVLWVSAFLVGDKKEPHKVHLIEKQNVQAVFSNRQKLQEYFTNWVKTRYPNPDSIQGRKPVYFVLSDGGASRSGYWVASVLSRFEDSTKGNFSRQLFCLSGASGGSVGNAAFYNILRNKKMFGGTNEACLTATTSYLESDFLTYTLARMLGPDVFRYVLPFLMPVKDRAFALTKALEEAPGANDLLAKSMTSGMSEIITQIKKPDSLPVLCINTTRMQDGRPGVISTLDMTEQYFNRRVDVLNLLDEKSDLKLSSAVVLGASFPYVSPAGRIDSRENDIEYFVDGGYFDNSGAGVVNEMIIGMRQLMESDSFLNKYKNKLNFFVLHITNDPYPFDGEPILEKVNPLINDLAAPVQTLAGAYGSQTSINDSRLSNYMKSNFGSGHYTRINLYKKNDKMSFSMNWVISKRALDSMDVRLETSDVVKSVLRKMLQ